MLENVRIHEKTKYTAVDENGIKYPVKQNNKTGELEIGNPYFFQFYKDNFNMIQKLIDENHLASRIFMFFIKNMDNTNALIVSYQVLEEIYGYKRTTISAAIKYLKINKYIDIQKSGNMNVYCVNAALVWTMDVNKLKYAKFNATVYISETEQSKTKKIFHSEIKTKK